MKLNVRMSNFPMARFAVPLIQLQAAARAALLGRLVGSRVAPATALDEPAQLSQPPDRST